MDKRHGQKGVDKNREKERHSAMIYLAIWQVGEILGPVMFGSSVSTYFSQHTPKHGVYKTMSIE